MAPDKSGLTPPPERGTVEVEIHPQPGVAVVAVRGEHDLLTQAELAEALERASAQRSVLVDLSECSFMDSSVTAALFVACKRLEERDGRLEVVIPREAHTLQSVAKFSGIHTFLPVHETRAAALASIRRRSTMSRPVDEHSIRIRDLRLRFGDTESYAAECSCGWRGQTHTGWQTAEREAHRDGAVHVDEHGSGHTCRQPRRRSVRPT